MKELKKIHILERRRKAEEAVYEMELYPNGMGFHSGIVIAKAKRTIARRNVKKHLFNERNTN